MSSFLCSLEVIPLTLYGIRQYNLIKGQNYQVVKVVEPHKKCNADPILPLFGLGE